VVSVRTSWLGGWLKWKEKHPSVLAAGHVSVATLFLSDELWRNTECFGLYLYLVLEIPHIWTKMHEMYTVG
jgi:hypothetical protein